jgi:hypothetical protein
VSALTVYQNRLRTVRLATARNVLARWDALEQRDRPQAEAFARQVAPIVAAGQVVAARTTAGYVARAARIKPPPIVAADVTGSAARKGADPLEEFQRPFITMWGGLGDGLEPEAAVAKGRARLDALVLADVWMASRVAMQIIQDTSDRVNGWIRAADASACEDCAAADGAPANDAGDLAFHPGCGCTAEPTPTPPESEPANADAFEVHEHDELGPVLTTAGESFATV